MTMAVVVELGGEPGHGQTQNECTADHSIVTVELKFRRRSQAMQRNMPTANPSAGVIQTGANSPGPIIITPMHTQWSDEGEQDTAMILARTERPAAVMMAMRLRESNGLWRMMASTRPIPGSSVDTGSRTSRRPPTRRRQPDHEVTSQSGRDP